MSVFQPEAIQQTISTAHKPDETLEQCIERNAALPRLEYERVRETDAKKWGIRVSVLDDEVAKLQKAMKPRQADNALFETVDPWPEPVDAGVLLNDIQSLVRFYIVCNSETAIAATLWIALTWFIDQVQVAPIAMITAPEKRCGKSQLLSLIGKLCSRPLIASNISTAALFRVIEAYSPTLLIDEADTFLKDNEEARGIINSGHTRQSAHVIRVVGDDHEPKQFSTWGPKVICGIGKQAETLMDRSVILELRRKLPDESVERLRHAEPLQFELCKRQLCRLSLDAGERIRTARPQLPEILNDRAQDNWEPLLAIADYAGGDWPQMARKAALKISGKESQTNSISCELLEDIQTVLEETCLLKIRSSDLIDHLCQDDMRPWATYNHGKPITARQLAKRLSEYGIEPKGIRIGAHTPKGYEREQFIDAFARYIPSSCPLPVEPPQRHTDPQSQSGQSFPPVAVFSSVADISQRGESERNDATPKGPEISQCCGVADTGLLDEEGEERLAIQQFDGGYHA